MDSYENIYRYLYLHSNTDPSGIVYHLWKEHVKDDEDVDIELESAWL